MTSSLKMQWSIPLIVSYIGSVYLYTMFNSTEESTLMTMFMLTVIGTFGYALYIIWQNYTSNESTQLFKQLALFAVILHGITIPINYFFQGIIGFLVALIMIYIFFNKFVKAELNQ